MSDRWPPSTIEDLERAMENGLVAEGHFVDVKRELPPAPKNTGIAIDLAAFSVDGGTIFVGIDEGPIRITPTALGGLAERIEQIGRASVDPPVTVRSVPIETGAKEGVLVITVPPSPSAPHMVEGQYRGRGETTNYVMSDAEVMRVRGNVRARKERVGKLLADYAAESIGTWTTSAWLFVVGDPMQAGPSFLLEGAGDEPTNWLHEQLLRGPLTIPMSPSWLPSFHDGLSVMPRADGWALHAMPRRTWTSRCMRMACSDSVAAPYSLTEDRRRPSTT